MQVEQTAEDESGRPEAAALTVRRATSAGDLQAAYRLRYQVFCIERGIYDRSHYPAEEETDRYDAYADHFLALIGAGPVGTVRCIRHSPLPFPVTQLAPLPGGVRPEAFAEVSRLAVLRATGAHQQQVLVALWQAINRHGLAQGITHWGARLDRRGLRLLRRLGVPLLHVGAFVAVDGEAERLVAVYADARATYERLTSPDLAQRLLRAHVTP